MIIYTFFTDVYLPRISTSFLQEDLFWLGPKELQTNLLPRKQETVISVVVGFNSFEKN